MLDQGISLRNVLMWAVFMAAGGMASAALLLELEALAWVAMTAANGGLVLVILGDNGKTRQLVWRAEMERKNAEHGVRSMH